MTSQDDHKAKVGEKSVLTYTITSKEGEKNTIKDSLAIGKCAQGTICADNMKVANKCAKLEIINGYLMLSDLNAEQEIFINGAQVVQNTRLSDEDTVRIEQETYTVKIEQSDIKLKQSDAKITRLHCFIDGVEQIVELPVENNSQASGWEIGRDKQCDIVLNHVSVSNKHAQIIHQKGRWKIINLVSTSGILINENKQLSAYISDGDQIGLGSVNLIFKTPDSSKELGSKTSLAKQNALIAVIVSFILIALAVIIYINL